jgi:DNA-binding CsgD family transcriptional regulator
MMGFLWCKLGELVPLSKGDHRMLSVGRANGIGDGFTVPRHLPGYASGSCTFAMRPDRAMPTPMLHVAEIVGAFALTSARRLAGEAPDNPRPVLTPRQRECVLWSARGKTAGETAAILGIGEDTVIQHLRTARERYDVHSRHALILCSLFDGLISFSDIRRWWHFH